MKPALLLAAIFCVATAGPLWPQPLSDHLTLAPSGPDGFVFCSDRDSGQPVPLYGRCGKRQIGSLNCGEKVTVIARNDDMLRIIPASQRAPRFVNASAISRQPDKFVPFDNDSGVPDRGPIDCSLMVQRVPVLDGFMFCSGNQNSVPLYLSPCSASSSSSLACGEKVSVSAHKGDMLQISTPDGLHRYAMASSVSQQPDKFVPFSDDSESSGIRELLGCEHEPERNVTPPRAIFNPPPEYSEEARKKKIHGTIVLSLVVTTDGTARDIKVEKGIGYGLDEKAVETVSRWKFSPALKDGEPVEKQIHVEVDFHLF